MRSSQTKPKIHFFWLGSSLPFKYKISLLRSVRLNSDNYDHSLWYDSRCFSREPPKLQKKNDEPSVVVELRLFCKRAKITLCDVADTVFYHDDIPNNHFIDAKLHHIVRRVDILRWDDTVLENGVYLDLDTAYHLQKPLPAYESIQKYMNEFSLPVQLNVEAYARVTEEIERYHQVFFQSPETSSKFLKKYPYCTIGLSNSFIVMNQKKREFVNRLRAQLTEKINLISFDGKINESVKSRLSIELYSGPAYIIAALKDYMTSINKPLFYEEAVKNQSDKKPLEYLKIETLLEKTLRCEKYREAYLRLIKIACDIHDVKVSDLIRHPKVGTGLNKPKIARIQTDLSWTRNGERVLHQSSEKHREAVRRIQGFIRSTINKKRKRESETKESEIKRHKSMPS